MKSYPLQWPAGERRTKADERKDAYFKKGHNAVTITEGIRRVHYELMRLGVDNFEDAIISTNLKLRLDGQPIGSQAEPADPGVAVYWKGPKDTQHKTMGIDIYHGVANNLAALAATLEAMRAIERHGGKRILERAFTGFLALPAPNTWRAVLGFTEDAGPTLAQVKRQYRQEAMGAHPDAETGNHTKMAELNWAMDEAERELTR